MRRPAPRRHKLNVLRFQLGCLVFLLLTGVTGAAKYPGLVAPGVVVLLALIICVATWPEE